MKTTTREHYLIDSKGKRRAVVIDVERYEQLLEDMDDLKVIAERKENPKLDSLRCIARLRKH